MFKNLQLKTLFIIDRYINIFLICIGLILYAYAIYLAPGWYKLLAFICIPYAWYLSFFKIFNMI